MRATGIVRRIDELGRVVIPKEIRRTLRIREGDPLEIYTDKDGEVILKKYSPIGEISNFAKDYTESLFRSLGHIACITDKDMIVSASGSSPLSFAILALVFLFGRNGRYKSSTATIVSASSIFFFKSAVSFP